jgi:hypothetical protein
VTRKLLRITVALVVFGAAFLTGMSSAGTRADTTVTIRREGTEPFGTVRSPRPRLCADDRRVVVYKQLGPDQDPQNDRRVGSDRTELQGEVGHWNIGQPGVYGRMYARAPGTPDCRADSSRTIRIPRPT